MLGPFDSRSVYNDSIFFKETVSKSLITMPVLALGGEASLGQNTKSLFSPVAQALEGDIVPKAGHWLADENPNWVAQRLIRFFDQAQPANPSIDLSNLADKVTLTVGYFGTLGNAAMANA